MRASLLRSRLTPLRGAQSPGPTPLWLPDRCMPPQVPQSRVFMTELEPWGSPVLSWAGLMPVVFDGGKCVRCPGLPHLLQKERRQS